MFENEELIARFHDWFTRNGGSYASGTSLSWSEAKGISVHLNRDTDPSILLGQPIVICPHALSISSLNALNINESFKNRLPFELPKQLLEKGSPRLVGAVFLCAQYLLGSESFWYDYFNVLPGVPGRSNDRGIGKVQNPLWWTDEEKSWLDGTNVERGVRDLLKSWELEWENWERTLTQWAGSVRLQGFDWNIFKWALSILGSRSFSSATVKHIENGSVLQRHNPHSLLYPGIDLLNHNPETKNKWRYDTNCFHIEMNDVINPENSPQTELWNTYGTQSNAQLLLSWGFCLSHNKYDSYALQLLTPRDGSSADSGHDHYAHHTDTGESQDDHLPVTADYLNATAEEARLGIYMVRDPKAIDADDDEYPPPDDQTTQHLRGFPRSLPLRIAQQIMNVRERRTQNEPTDASPSKHNSSQASGRCKLATCDLLHQKLTVVLAQQLEDSESPYAAARRLPRDQLSALSRQRLDQVRAYREGQARLLRSNISGLERRLSDMKQTEAVETGLPELVTLPRLLEYIQTKAASLYQQLSAGEEFDTAFPDGTLFRVARDDLFMCLAIAALHLQEPTASELQDSQFDILLQRVRERTTWYYQAEKVNPKSLQFTGFARGQDAMMWVEEVTAYAERARSVTGSGIWHSAAWGDYVFLRAIVLLVMEESFELDVNDDTTEIAIYLGPGDSD